MVQFNMNVGVSICSNDCGGVAGCSGGDRYGNAIRSGGGGGGAIDGGGGGCGIIGVVVVVVGIIYAEAGGGGSVLARAPLGVNGTKWQDRWWKSKWQN